MINWLKELLLEDCESIRGRIKNRVKELEEKREKAKYLEVEGEVFNEFVSVNGKPTIHTGFRDADGLFPRFMQEAARKKKKVRARIIIEVLE